MKANLIRKPLLGIFLALLVGAVISEPAAAQSAAAGDTQETALASPDAPRVDAKQGGAALEVTLNQVDTSSYPKVSIFATVLRDGAPVLGLTADDFRVREDEVDQEPLTVEEQRVPLNAVVTLDTSGSIKKALPAVQAAASGFLDILDPGDHFTVIGFSREVKKLSTAGDRDGAKSAIASTVARGDTALYDALYESVVSAASEKGRKAVVLLSDGVDDDGRGRQLSKHSLAEGIELAVAQNVPVFTIGLGSEIDSTVLQKIATETGAKYLPAPEPDDLKSLYDSLGKQLQGQYGIYYTSNLPADGQVHRIRFSFGNAFSVKEFTSPSSGTTTAATTVAKTVTTTSEAAKHDVAIVPAGIHITAVMSEGGPNVEVDRFKIFPDDSQFDEPKAVAESDYTVKSWSKVLPAGKYRVTAKKGPIEVESKVELSADNGVRVVMNLNAASLQTIAKMTEATDRVKVDKFWTVTGEADEDSRALETHYGDETWTTLVPAGKVTIFAKRGAAIAKKVIDVQAGSQLKEALVFGGGVVNAIALLSEGGQRVQANRFQILTPDTGFDEPKVVESTYGTEKWTITLPAGKYLLAAKVGEAEARRPIELGGGEIKNEAVVLNAGTLEAIVTKSAGGSPLRAKKFFVKDMGNGFDDPKNVYTAYSEDRVKVVLPAGKYVVGAQLEDREHEVPVEVKAGEKLQQEIVFAQ